MTDASSDEFIAELEDEFGLEGYARWWKLLETIAVQMDETDRCSVAYPVQKWLRILKAKRNKLTSFLVYCELQLKINMKQTGNILEIECPKLLEIRDNHSANLQAKRKRLASKEVEVEVDKELEVEEPLVLEIVQHLNETLGTNYSHKTASTASAIKARLGDGYTLEDFKIVHVKKHSEWNGTEQQRYLRPSTLYRPSKFEEYLNQVIVEKKGKHDWMKEVK